MTTFEYDDAGRVVRAVTVSEALWTPDDVAVALASRHAAGAPRGAHGLLLSEVTDPEHAAEWDVPLPKRDFALKKLNEAQAERRKRYPDDDGASLLWTVTRG